MQLMTAFVLTIDSDLTAEMLTIHILKYVLFFIISFSFSDCFCNTFSSVLGEFLKSVF